MTDKCIGCGKPAALELLVRCCDECQTRVDQSIGALSVEGLGPVAVSFARDRVAAINRARLATREWALTAARLADGEIPDAEVTELVRRVNGAGPASSPPSRN